MSVWLYVALHDAKPKHCLDATDNTFQRKILVLFWLQKAPNIRDNVTFYQLLNIVDL